MRVAEWRAPGRIELAEREAPVAADGQLVIDVRTCGICGSDLHSFRDGLAASPGQVLGHEFSGVVSQVAGVAGVNVGDRVTARPLIPCGDCPGCRSGNPQLCENGHENNIGYASAGGFAERLLVPRAELGQTVFVLPPSVSDTGGAIVEPLAVGLHAVRRSRLSAGSSVLVLGAGMIGLGVVALLRLHGVEDITVADPSALRRERARVLGARAVIDPISEDITLRMRELTGPGMSGRGARVDGVIDCAGSQDALAHALKSLRQGGTLVLAAVFGRPMTLHLDRFVDKELDVFGSFAYRDEFAAIVDLLADGAIDPELFVSHRFDLADIQAAFETQLDPERALKVLVSP